MTGGDFYQTYVSNTQAHIVTLETVLKNLCELEKTDMAIIDQSSQ